jgi:hypothetical protein
MRAIGNVINRQAIKILSEISIIPRYSDGMSGVCDSELGEADGIGWTGNIENA